MPTILIALCVFVLILNSIVLAAVCKIARALLTGLKENPATQLFGEFFDVNTMKGE